MPPDRDTYNQMDSPALQGLGYYARAQVTNLINTTILAEVVDQAGGEVILPPGFAQRTGRRLIWTRFLDDDSYRIWTSEVKPEHDHPGAGTRWERQAGPRRRSDTPDVWEVERMDEHMCTLRRIDPVTGAEIASQPMVTVRTDYLRRGVGGWTRWTPPPGLIEALGGQQL